MNSMRIWVSLVKWSFQLTLVRGVIPLQKDMSVLRGVSSGDDQLIWKSAQLIETSYVISPCMGFILDVTRVGA